MCRLFGLVCNRVVDLAFTLPHFSKLSDGNPDTWGIAWYADDVPVMRTGAGKMADSPDLSSLKINARGRIIISHVRLARSEPYDERGAHPFIDQALGRHWVFAHNGDIDRAWIKCRLDRAPNLGPDSRFYFRYLIEKIEKSPGKSVEESLVECLPELKKHSKISLNFLMSDGFKLYAFCGFNSNRRRYTLQLARRPRIESRQLASQSAGYRQMLDAKLRMGEKAILVCSQDITKREGELWDPIDNGTLLTVERDSLRLYEQRVW